MILTILPAKGHSLQCSNVVERIIPNGLNIPKMAMDMIKVDWLTVHKHNWKDQMLVFIREATNNQRNDSRIFK